MRLTIYSSSATIHGTIRGIANSIIKSNPLSKALSDYKVMNDSEESGVKEILIITDIAKYRGEINFAYKTLGKILQSGGKIDLKHTVVGTTLNGKPFEVNLSNSSYTSIAIMAGSGSGKGVLTMALLAAMVAAGCPVVYLDYKPDMAGALWDLERKYNTPVLAVDGLNHRTATARPVRGYVAGYGVPKELAEEVTPELGTIAYVKGVQIMNLLGGAKLNGAMPKDKKTFFILDEAEKCGVSVDAAKGNIEEILKANKPRGKESPSENYLYLKKLYALYSTVGKSADEFLKTNARSGNMGALTIGQSAYVNAWRGPFKSMATQSAVKFLGTGSEKGGAGIAKDVDGKEMLGMGYFGFVNGVESSRENTTMIKTTLVLNDADFDVNSRTGGTFTGSLLGNIHDDSLKESIIDNDMIVSATNDIAINAGLKVGQANPLVGFPGLIEFIGNNGGNFDIGEAISRGYREVETLLTKLGILGETGHYADVEGYMYSAKEDSIFSFAQLSSALNAGITIYDYLENGVETEESISDNAENGEVIDIWGSEGNSGNIANSEISDSDGLDSVFEEDGLDGDDAFKEFSTSTKEQYSPEDILNNTGEKEAIIGELLGRLQSLGVDLSGVQIPDEDFNSSDSTDFSDNIEVNDSIESYADLVGVVTNDLLNKFGGLENIKSFKVIGGSIIVNGYYYRCRTSGLFARGIPYDVKRDMDSGNISKLFNYSLLSKMRGLRDLEFDSVSFAYDYVSPSLGYGTQISVDKMFRDLKALQSLRLGSHKFSRSSYMEEIKGDDTFYKPRLSTKMADASESILGKSSKSSWEFTKRTFNSNKYGKVMKALGVTGGIAVAATTGIGSVTVKGGRKLFKGLSSLGRDLKSMMDESNKLK